jgi:uncharacterized membrane protein
MTRDWAMAALRWGGLWLAAWLVLAVAASMLRAAALNSLGLSDRFIEDVAFAVRSLILFVLYPALLAAKAAGTMISGLGGTVLTRGDYRKRVAATLEEKGVKPTGKETGE